MDCQLGSDSHGYKVFEVFLCVGKIQHGLFCVADGSACMYTMYTEQLQQFVSLLLFLPCWTDLLKLLDV